MHMQIKKLSQEFQTIFQHYYHLEKVIIGKTKSIETTNFFFFYYLPNGAHPLQLVPDFK